MTGFFSRLSCPAAHAGHAAKVLAHVASRFAGRLSSPHKSAHARRDLMALNGHVLNDIGLSRWEVETLS